jgi:hypothetical protein
MHPKTHPLSSKPAQAMLEMALVLPLFLVLVLGVIELGRMFFTFSAVFSSAREASRYGSASGMSERSVPYFKDCIGMRAAARRVGFTLGLQDNQIDIRYDSGPNDPRTWNSLPTCESTYQPILGDRVLVHVTTNFVSVVPLSLPVVPIDTLSSRTILRSVGIEGTPAPTSTRLPTSTASPTNTNTATITNTATMTSTVTETPTVTQTPTDGPSPTPTNTPIPTNTPTDTPTFTPTNTPTNTPTFTPTNTFTPTPTPTIDCSMAYLEGAVNTGTKFIFQIRTVNPLNPLNPPTVTLTSLRITWTNDVMVTISLASVIWPKVGTGSATSPLQIAQDGWRVGASRDITGTANLTFTFDKKKHVDHNVSLELRKQNGEICTYTINLP